MRKTRIFLLLLCALLLLLPVTADASQTGDVRTALRGDVNGDGETDFLDVLTLMKQIAADLPELDRRTADVDGNGAVNLTDALYLLRHQFFGKEGLPQMSMMYLSKAEYAEKTKAGFLGQLVGMLSGYEFVTLPNGRQQVGMPDDWYAFCAGPYGAQNPHKVHSIKRLYNAESGLWEIWLDDDFSVDIFNQYAIRDSFAETGGFSTRFIGEAWTKYDIYDMGGGNRDAGAFHLIDKYGMLTPFAGNTEFGNRYSYCTEPYLGADTVGMNYPGMPRSAMRTAGACASVTGDRDNVEWAKMFAAMYSMAYFETDIQTLIRRAAKVFPQNSWEMSVVNKAFELYETYPDDWRTAYHAMDDAYYVEEITKQTNNSINCGFVLLDLLYGGGDYDTTCKIGSLAGYDCESTCGIALSILGVMQGERCLPDAVNTMVWQDGEGTLVNLPIEGTSEGLWMVALNLPERMKITEILDLYRENFENALRLAGGEVTEDGYWIPTETMDVVKEVPITNGGFETGDLTGFTATGTAELCDMAVTGRYGLRLTDKGSISQTVAVEPGKTYRLSAFVRAVSGGIAYLYVDNGGEKTAVSTRSTERFSAQENEIAVARSLTFTAVGETVEIGYYFYPTKAEISAVIDDIRLREVEEASVGSVEIRKDGEATVFTVRSAHVGEEVALRVYYQNTGIGFAVGALTLNGESRDSVCFGKPAGPTYYGKTDFIPMDAVTFPLTVEAGEAEYRMTFTKGEASILGAELVRITDRFAE